MVWCQIINTCYASGHKQGFSLIPDTLLLLSPPPLCSIFSAFSSPFNHIPSGLSCDFEWGREGRGERECSQFRCIPPWLQLLFSGSEYEAILQIIFGLRFCCYFWGKEGRGDVGNKGSTPSSPFHTHQPLGSTSKIWHLLKLKPQHKILKTGVQRDLRSF